MEGKGIAYTLSNPGPQDAEKLRCLMGQGLTLEFYRYVLGTAAEYEPARLITGVRTQADRWGGRKLQVRVMVPRVTLNRAALKPAWLDVIRADYFAVYTPAGFAERGQA